MSEQELSKSSRKIRVIKAIKGKLSTVKDKEIGVSLLLHLLLYNLKLVSKLDSFGASLPVY